MSDVQKKILIVEDDLHISKVYEIQLAREGFFTILARDGEEALKLFEQENPNIVILDLMIPKKDGFEVLEEIRKNSKYSKIPILILSNLGQKTDESRALKLGATEYLVKIDHPIQEVVNKIKSYLEI
jgi:two-component system alkaline phosphatase synthesis response regulator PhoP